MRIEKAASQPEPHIREQQSAALEQAAHKDVATTGTPADLTERERHLERWLGEVYETVVQLLDIYNGLVPALVQDREVESGLRILRGLAEGMRVALQREVAKLGEDRPWGQHQAHVLREALFPARDAPHTPFTVLETLQALHIYVARIQGGLYALEPASQALWDSEFQAAVADAQTTLRRTQAWIVQQIKVRSPQTLLVPSSKA